MCSSSACICIYDTLHGNGLGDDDDGDDVDVGDDGRACRAKGPRSNVRADGAEMAGGNSLIRHGQSESHARQRMLDQNAPAAAAAALRGKRAHRTCRQTKPPHPPAAHKSLHRPCAHAHQPTSAGADSSSVIHHPKPESVALEFYGYIVRNIRSLCLALDDVSE